MIVLSSSSSIDNSSLNFEMEDFASFDPTEAEEMQFVAQTSSEDDDMNSEKRKEKSRKAARERRSQESKIFDQIEELLPVSTKSLQHLDKASLVRVAINYLKIRSLVEPLVGDDLASKDLFSLDQSSLNNSLNGFVIVMSKDGDIVYLSDSVEHHLGLNSVELLGQSIYDYSHPCDHEEIKTLLEPLTNACSASKFLPKPSERARKSFAEATSETSGPFFIRIKSKIGNKGRNINLKSANYKVVKFAGRMIDLEVASPEYAQMIGSNYRHYLIATGELIQHPNSIEMPLPNDVFMSKHDPDMKFTYVDDRIEKLFGFRIEDLVGTSFYQYFDASNFKSLNQFFKTLFAKGQCDTGYYKFLVKTGGYRWISTQATVIKEPNSNQPQSIILINRIISGVENAHLITSNVQNLNHAAVNSTVALEPIVKPQPILPVSATASVLKPKFAAFGPAVESYEVSDVLPDQAPTSSTYEIVATAAKSNVAPGPPDYCQSTLPQFTSSTETVLAPKTADMESGFLVFTEDKGMTILTDADDLTHLAPDAGDLCVPMLPEMDFNDLSLFDDIFLNSTSFNLNSNTNIFSEDDLINNFANIDNDKLKLDGLDVLNLETENTSSTTKKLNNHSTGNNNCNNTNNNNNNFLEINEKEIPSMKSINFDQQYPLSNDPFLSFTNQSDELFLSNLSKTRSDCSLTDPYSSTSNSPSNSSSSSSMQYLPKSTSCEEITNKLSDSVDFVDDKDLEMRAPFIPIDDDLLLSDLSYTDTNLDDLFNWISNGGYNQCNTNNANGKQHFPNDKSNGDGDKSFKSKQPNSQSSNKNGGGCLEALLQNDELVCNLKNKMYSSNQILNRQQINQLAIVQNSVPQKTIGQTIQTQATSAMKRKNSNILIYTTLANSGEKKFKNIVLTADALGDSKLDEKSNIHHFVLTKNNELIPKASFSNQLSNFRVSSKRVLESATDSLINNISLSSTGSSDSDSSQLKENLFYKKARPELEKTHSNSVLLNLLVSGADLPNGYDIMRNYQVGNKHRDNSNLNSHMMTTNGLSLSFRH